MFCLLLIQSSYVRQCQKCQKPPEYPFGTFGTPSVSVFGEIHALLWERRGERPEALPVLVCYEEKVVECNAEQAADVQAYAISPTRQESRPPGYQLYRTMVISSPCIGRAV